MCESNYTQILINIHIDRQKYIGRLMYNISHGVFYVHFSRA